MPNWQNEAQTDVRRSREWMDSFMQGNKSRQELLDNLVGRYGSQAEALYQQLLQTPGLTDQEIDRMLMEVERRGLTLNEGDARNNYLTEGEIAQIVGNPYSWQEGFAERQRGIDNAFGEGRGRIQGVLGQGAERQRGVNNAARGETGGIVDTLDRRLQENANDPRLALTEGYGAGLEGLSNAATQAGRGAIGETTGKIDESLEGLAADPAALAAIRNVNVADIEGVAGRAAGAQTNRVMNAIQRQAQAVGTNPLLMGYLAREIGTDGANEAAKARADARVMAEREKRGAEATAEEMRMSGAGRRSSALQSGAMGLLNARLENENRGAERTMGARQNAETMRLGQQGVIAGLREGAAARAGGAALEAAQTNANREAATESELAQRGLNTEAGLTGDYLNWMQGQQGYLTDAQRQSENTNAQRQALVATNRQGTTQGNQQNRFTQGNTTLNNIASVWGNAADARRQGESEARQGITSMWGQAGNWGNQNQQNQISGFTAGSNAAANATQNGNQAASRPGLWERIAGMGVGVMGAASGAGGFSRLFRAQGGVIDKPTDVLMGEYGPEFVVPADPSKPRIPEASMSTIDKILPTATMGMGMPKLFGNMSYEELRREKLKSAAGGARRALGVLG